MDKFIVTMEVDFNSKEFNCKNDKNIMKTAVTIDIQENLPHRVTEVICINCKYRWLSVRPEVTLLKELECPNCHEQGYTIETGEIIN